MNECSLLVSNRLLHLEAVCLEVIPQGACDVLFFNKEKCLIVGKVAEL